MTGKLTGVWIDASGQVAFVWDTDLILYLMKSSDTQAERTAEFREKARTNTEAAPWVLTRVRGDTALGVEHEPGVPSSVTFQFVGVALQFVGPSQTLDELVELAESTTSR